MTYKWQNIHLWLNDWMAGADKYELRWAITQLSLKLDSDNIQDVFEAQMDDWGYFEEIEEQCSQCYYKKIAREEDGWCYMFRGFMENCAKYQTSSEQREGN